MTGVGIQRHNEVGWYYDLTQIITHHIWRTFTRKAGFFLRYQLTYRSECQGRPVEAVDILSGETRVVCPRVVVHPIVLAKPYGEAHGKVDAGIPVNEDEDAEDDFTDAEYVGVACSSLGAIEEFQHPWHSE